MKTWVKVVLGVALVPVILLLVGILALVSTGKWKDVAAIGGDVFQMQREAGEFEKLQKDYPFKPPEDGRFTEERLQSFLAVSEAVKPAADAYDAWAQAAQGKKGDIRDAQKALTGIRDLMEISTRTLRTQKMSVNEFGWISRAVRKAREEAEVKAGSPMVLEILVDLRRLASLPSLPESEREDLRKKIERYEKATRAAGRPLSANAELYRKYADRLARADLGEFGSMLLQGRSPRRRDGNRSEPRDQAPAPARNE